ncbi:MAG TPA: universal stress protein [Allosphingosinicella sp.]
MKSILLYANADGSLESRLQAALDVARASSGHIICLQATPYDAFILGDPFGGVYALPQVVEEVNKTNEDNKKRLEDRLSRESVSWSWLEYDGQPAQLMVDRSRLADIVVVSLPDKETRKDGPLWIAADVAVHARSLVLAVPKSLASLDCFGAAMVAWNGSVEGSNALRQALPMLKLASSVHIVTVTDDETGFPATQACEYLGWHGLRPELHEWSRGEGSVAEALLRAASNLTASYVVMGAYGHSRIREAVLGGVTSAMLRQSSIPLILGR